MRRYESLQGSTDLCVTEGGIKSSSVSSHRVFLLCESLGSWPQDMKVIYIPLKCSRILCDCVCVTFESFFTSLPLQCVQRQHDCCPQQSKGSPMTEQKKTLSGSSAKTFSSKCLRTKAGSLLSSSCAVCENVFHSFFLFF